MDQNDTAIFNYNFYFKLCFVSILGVVGGFLFSDDDGRSCDVDCLS